MALPIRIEEWEGNFFEGNEEVGFKHMKGYQPPVQPTMLGGGSAPLPQNDPSAVQVSPLADPAATGGPEVRNPSGWGTDVQEELAPVPGTPQMSAPRIGMPSGMKQAQGFAAAGQKIANTAENVYNSPEYQANQKLLNDEESYQSDIKQEMGNFVAGVAADYQSVQRASAKKVADVQDRLGQFQVQLQEAYQNGSKDLHDYTADTRTKAFWGSIIARSLGMLGQGITGRGLGDPNANIANEIVAQGERAIDLETKTFQNKIKGYETQIKGGNQLIKTLREITKDEQSALLAYKGIRLEELGQYVAASEIRAKTPAQKMKLAETKQVVADRRAKLQIDQLNRQSQVAKESADMELQVAKANQNSQLKTNKENLKAAGGGELDFAPEDLVPMPGPKVKLTNTERTKLREKVTSVKEILSIAKWHEQNSKSLPQLIKTAVSSPSKGYEYVKEAEQQQARLKGIFKSPAIQNLGASLTATELKLLDDALPSNPLALGNWFADTQAMLNRVMAKGVVNNLKNAAKGVRHQLGSDFQTEEQEDMNPRGPKIRGK